MLKTLTKFNRLPVPRLVPQHHQLTHNQSIAEHLKNCSNLKQLECLYAFMIKNNSNQDCFVMNQFITVCTTFHRTDYAVQAFTQMKNPNVFVHNAMIRGFVHSFSPIRALEFYIDMLKAQICPSSYTFSSIVKGCALVSALRLGESVHGQIWRFGFSSHLYVQTALIDFYSSLGRIVGSRQVFDEMPERDSFAWTTMISAHARAGDMDCARGLFDEMSERNTASWNAVVDGYSRIGDVESAEFLFKKMPARDLISWTTMINCYSQNKQYREALLVFTDMKNNGIGPDEVTMASVISASAHLGVLDLGKEIHLYVMQNGFDVDVYMGSALVDMYAKCGSLDRALVVFFKLREKNLFCWNSVIEGLAVHGYANEALAMFKKMVKDNIKPNNVTFVSILSACTHAGLVEEGRKSFLSMTRDFFIPPEIEHYGCMVDLLCKAGLLDDALELIRSMRTKPNSVVWGALLGGCKIHKNLEIAQVAVSQLIILEPNNSGYYTLFVNMFAEANRWSEVARVRANMKELGVEKRCPGSSWIEIDRRIHHFAASDKSHHSTWEISLLLEELDGQLKLAGFLPEYIFAS